MKVKFRIVKICYPATVYGAKYYAYGIKKRGLFGWKYMYDYLETVPSFCYGICGCFKSKKEAQVFLVKFYRKVDKAYEV